LRSAAKNQICRLHRACGHFCENKNH
jgi:hypothetical protein